MSSLIEKPLYLDASNGQPQITAAAVPAGTLILSIRRHLLAVLLTLFLIPAAAAAIVWQIPSRYAATASVQVQTRSRDLRDAQAVAYDSASDPSIVTTEIDVLRSTDLAMAVVRNLHLDQNPEFVGPPEGLDQIVAWIGSVLHKLTGGQSRPAPPETIAMRMLLNITTIANKERSNVINITVATRHPALSVQVADGYAMAYLDFLRGLKEARVLHAGDLLMAHLVDLKQKQLAAEQAAETFRQARGLAVVAGASAGGTQGPTVVGQQLAELNRQLVVAGTARAQAEANLQQARTLTAAGKGGSTPQVLLSPVIHRLRELEADLIGRKASTAAHVVADSPILDRLNAQITAVRGQIADETSKVIASLGSEVKAAHAREEALNNDLRDLSNRLDTQGNDMVRLRQLEAEATATGAIYQDYLQQQKRMTTGADLQLPDADIIAKAKEPPQPSSPKRTLITLGALAVSCVLASLLALTLERNHKGFQSAEEFTSETGISALGLLPQLSRRARRRFAAAPQPRRYQEVLDLIAMRLWVPDAGRRGRLMAVTSAVPAEGKTWLSISLAASLSQIGARTLLIDCDLRRGSIARALGIARPGLTEVHHYDVNQKRSGKEKGTDRTSGLTSESGQAALPVPELRLFEAARRAGVVRSFGANLDVIPVFSSKTNALEFLTSSRFKDFLDDARSRYDIILIDTPPLMMVADGLILSRMADSVLLATQWCRTPRSMVLNTIRVLSESGAYVAGSVLTMVNTRRYASARLGDNAYLYRKYAGY